MKDMRKLTHHRKAIFFENGFDIKRLSVKLEEDELQRDDDSNSNSSSCSSTSSHNTATQHLLPKALPPHMTSSQSMNDLLSSNSYSSTHHQAPMLKSKSCDIRTNHDNNEDQASNQPNRQSTHQSSHPTYHYRQPIYNESSHLMHQSSEPIPIRVTLSSETDDHGSSSHSSLSRSYDSLHNSYNEPLNMDDGRSSSPSVRGLSQIPCASMLRHMSLQKAKSFESLLAGRFDAGQRGLSSSSPVIPPSVFKRIGSGSPQENFLQNAKSNIRRTWLQKAKSFDSLQTDENSAGYDGDGTNSLPHEIVLKGLSLADRNATMTSSVRNLADRNVRENNLPKVNILYNS